MNPSDLDQEISDLLSRLRQANQARRRVLANLDAVTTLTDNPEARAALEAGRLEELRAAEDQALSVASEAKARSREVQRLLSVDIGVTLSADDWTKAAAMRGFVADQVASVGRAQLANLLEGAHVSGDPATAYTYARAIETRLRAGNLETLRTGPEDEAVSIGRLQGLISDIDASLRSPAADPVRTHAEELAIEADRLQSMILQARSNRGEGPSFGNPRVKTVAIDDHLSSRQEFDIAGRQIAG